VCDRPFLDLDRVPVQLSSGSALFSPNSATSTSRLAVHVRTRTAVHVGSPDRGKIRTSAPPPRGKPARISARRSTPNRPSRNRGPSGENPSFIPKKARLAFLLCKCRMRDIRCRAVTFLLTVRTGQISKGKSNPSTQERARRA